MVKEDNQWKLLETLSYDKVIHGYDEGLATINSSTNGDDTLSVTIEENTYEFSSKVMTDATRKNITDEILTNKAILASEYDTYQEARAAVDSIDINTGNYLALIQQLPTIS